MWWGLLISIHDALIEAVNPFCLKLQVINQADFPHNVSLLFEWWVLTNLMSVFLIKFSLLAVTILMVIPQGYINIRNQKSSLNSNSFN